jgi:hypothetical protein
MVQRDGRPLGVRLEGSATSVTNITVIDRGTFTYVVIMNHKHLFSQYSAAVTFTVIGQHAWQH